MARTRFALLLTCMLPLAASAADSAAGDTSAPVKETCKELAARVRKSECVRPVARFLEGSAVTVGMALASGQLELSRNDSVLAYLVGVFMPVPYYGFALPTSYFGGSRWGYEFSFLYTNSVAVDQRFARGDEDELIDVGTYASMTFVSVSSSAFISFGARDEDPDTFIRMGVGTGFGWAAVRGTAYFTEDASAGNLGCREAGDSLVAGRYTRREYREACALQSYRHASAGFSARGFLAARWRFLYMIWGVESVRISSGAMEYAPIEASLKLAWIHDL